MPSQLAPTANNNTTTASKPCPCIDRVLSSAAAYPHPPTLPPSKRYAYGTAGFRTCADALPGVMFRVGLLAALRSATLSGATVGIMVTASHNPAQDNGVKIVEPTGDMLLESWEPLAEDLANAASSSDVVDALKRVATLVGVTDFSSIEKSCNVVIARDTRPSGLALVAAACAAVTALSGRPPRDSGVLTTPQLHYVTRCMNDTNYGLPSADGYIDKFCTAFRALVGSAIHFPKLVVDCANGVGAVAMARVKDALKGTLDIQLVCTNTDDAAVLNLRCGADFVKTNNCAPDEVLAYAANEKNKTSSMTDTKSNSKNTFTLYASLDGDADRLVCYDLRGAKFRLLDGDRIAALLATALARDAPASLRPALVQTAYANGAASAYVRDELKLPLATTPTGVKHLHAKAHTYDLCVYFEPNGHGTVLYNTHNPKYRYDGNDPSLAQLGLWRTLTNETVGDGIADLLLVVAALVRLPLKNHLDSEKDALHAWCAMYTELPSRMGKVCVRAREALVVAKEPSDESRLERPDALQREIDRLVKSYTCASTRAFVRPSGTEDVVRVYVESKTDANCEALLRDISRAVYDIAGGIGARP